MRVGRHGREQGTSASDDRVCESVRSNIVRKDGSGVLAYRSRICGLSSSANAGKPLVIISHVIKTGDRQSQAAGHIDCPIADQATVKKRNRVCVSSSIVPRVNQELSCRFNVLIVFLFGLPWKE